MGYAFSVYGVDTQKVAAFGDSADTKLLATVLKNQARDVAANRSWFEDEIGEGAPDLAAALTEIAAGKCSNKASGFQYAYAVELLCKQFGKRIDDLSLAMSMDETIDPFLEVAKIKGGTLKLLGVGVLPIKIPRPDDFPLYGTLDPDGVTKLAAAMKALQPLTKGTDAEAVVTELASWAKQAKTTGLVWFTY
jgi:hypothetical protein